MAADRADAEKLKYSQATYNSAAGAILQGALHDDWRVYPNDNNITHQTSSSHYADDELLAWFQYHMDDVHASYPPDIFQHEWSPVLAPLSAVGSSFSPRSSTSCPPPSVPSSSQGVKQLPQLQSEAFMASRKADRACTAHDWSAGISTNRSEPVQHGDEKVDDDVQMMERGAIIGLDEVLLAGKSKGEAGKCVLGDGGEENRDAVGANILLESRKSMAKDATCKGIPFDDCGGLASRQKERPLPSEDAARAKRQADAEFQHRVCSVNEREHWLKGMLKKSSNKEHSQAHSDVDAVLALGAGRAAGIIKPSNVEAFTKVRTSKQPNAQRATRLESPSSSDALHTTSKVRRDCSSGAARMLLPKPPHSSNESRAAAPRLLLPKPSPSEPYIVMQPPLYHTGDFLKLPNFAHLHRSMPCVGLPNAGFQHEQNFDAKGQDNIITSKELIAEKLCGFAPLCLPRLDAEANMAAGGGSALALCQPSLELGADVAAGVGNTPTATTLSDTDALNKTKLSGVSILSHERRVPDTCSGGSHTSEGLKEEASGSKRKAEDSCEDAEGESVVESEALMTCTRSRKLWMNEVHNLSERRRRNRINDKMNALRELIPNASKSNKATLLDEAIDYLKNLQFQLQLMSMQSGVSLKPMAVFPASMSNMQIAQRPLPLGVAIDDMAVGSSTAGTTMGFALPGVSPAATTMGFVMPVTSYGAASAQMGSTWYSPSSQHDASCNPVSARTRASSNMTSLDVHVKHVEPLGKQ